MEKIAVLCTITKGTQLIVDEDPKDQCRVQKG
mgnify:CR=1 FL=1